MKNIHKLFGLHALGQGAVEVPQMAVFLQLRQRRIVHLTPQFGYTGTRPKFNLTVQSREIC